MLKKLRIFLAAIVFIAFVLLFLTAWEGIASQLGFLSNWQFMPALLALNFVIIAILVAVTLLFGRIYCSVLCPLGTLQDIFWKLGTIGKKNKLKQTPSKEKKIRYIVWVVFVATLIAGLSYLLVLLDPFGLFGKMVSTAGGEAVGTVVPIVSAVAFVVIAVLSWKYGRTWCNTICPVGTTLGFFSRFALFRPVIDADACKNCHACEKKCKAACIDIAEHKIDYSRCVDCFNCIEDCKFGAIKYKGWDFSTSLRSGRNDKEATGRNDKEESTVISSEAEKSQKKAADAGRRAFLASSAMIATAATIGAQNKKVDGGLAAIEDKKIPVRTVPLTPFGSESVKDFYKKCVACQLCVSVCPNNVLRPSTDLDRLMQPEMSYEKGYCRPECTECSKVCPADAIIPITPEEKTQMHIGVASVDRSLCVAEDGISCGNCARHCPVGAILMVPKDMDDENSPYIPVVDEAKCIGCGACENLCPSRPFSAITVNGLSVHIKD